MSYSPRPEGAWIENVSAIHATDTNRWEANQKDSSDRLDVVEPALAGKQTADVDLTTIAGLDSGTAGALVTDGSGWIRKTYTQLKAALGLATIATSGKLADATDVTVTGAQVGQLLAVSGVSPVAFGLVNADGSSQAVTLAETWTGSDGAAWPAAWTTFGPTEDIQSNAGRAVTGTGAYATAGGRVAGVANGEMLVRWKWTTAASERYVCFGIRSDTTLELNSYELLISQDTGAVRKFVAGTPTTLASVSAARAVGTTYRTRIRWVGSTITTRTWVDGATEPTSWDHTVTDTSTAQAGVAIVRGLSGGAGGAAQTTVFDDFTLSQITLAPVKLAPGYPGQGAVAIGDSITNLNGAGAATGPRVPDAHFGLGLIYSQQALQWRGVYATDGYTLEQIRDTHLPTVLGMSPAPAACLILGGTNNCAVGGFTAAAAIAVLDTICDALAAVGIRPVLATIPPRGDNTSYNQNVNRFNRALRSYANTNGYDLIDYARVLTNPATGLYKTALVRTDALHPSYAGAKVMGTELAATLAKLPIPRIAPPLALHPLDPTNLLGAAGNFQTDTNADGVGNNWTSLGLGGGSASIVTDADGATKWQRLTMPSGGSGNALLQWSGTGLWSAGDIIEVCARVQTNNFDATLLPSAGPSDGGTGAAWGLNLDFTGAASPNDKLYPAYIVHTDVTDGVIYARGVVGSSATGAATLTMVLFGQPPSSSVWVQMTGIAVRNLTALGLA